MAKHYKNRVKRRVILAIMDQTNILLWVSYGALTRGYAHNGDGLTPKELEFMQKRCMALKGICHDMSRLQLRIFDEVKMW